MAVDMTPVWQWVRSPPTVDTPGTTFPDHSYATAHAGRKGEATDADDSTTTSASTSTPAATQSASTPTLATTQSASTSIPAAKGATSSVTGKRTNGKYACLFCTKKMSSRQALFKHKKRYHPTRASDSVGNCSCQLCDQFSCVTLQELIKHYRLSHHQDIQIQTRTFNSTGDFNVWKKMTERDTSAQFCRASKVKTYTDHSVAYYYCHRSGEERHTVTVSQTKRAKMVQGSKKIGCKCTAFLKVHTTLDSGIVKVDYCLQHIGHMNMSDEMRTLIVGKLAKGVEINMILDEIRENVTKLNGDALVTRKHIQNIKTQYRYNISFSGNQKHKEDSVSVDLWVQELQSDSCSPILFYKPQGHSHSTLHQDDFLLCIQTDFQRNCMIDNASKIICIDSTHKTTQYDFLLTTILVLDKCEETVPVAWAISNRVDAEVLQVFFRSLKEACGQDFTVDIFMSDLANKFYNAWCATFCRPVKRLYCSWHIDECWRKQLHDNIHSHEDRATIYFSLKTLQYVTDEAKFRSNLHRCLTDFEHYPDFLQYFQNNFVTDNKIFLWAACFRIQAIANTNMYIEAFHHVLKSIYFRRKQNRRVDYLLTVLLRLARDKAVEGLIKSQKGKVTCRMQDILKIHKEAENVRGIQVNPDADAEWLVPSTVCDNKMYTVKRILTGTEICHCKLVCGFCQVCIHMYECNCPDYLIRPIACNHIHAVHKDSQQQPEQNYVEVEDGDNLNLFESVFCKDEPETSNYIQHLKQVALSKASDIIELVNKADDVETLRAVLKCLQDVYTIGTGLKKSSSTDFEKTAIFPPNKNFASQKRLFSTKRKRNKKSKSKLPGDTTKV